MEIVDMVLAWPILRWGAMALMGAGIVGGSFLALDRFDADARSRDTLHLFGLLDPPPLFSASTETSIRSIKGTGASSDLALLIRVALVSQTPIQSIRASVTMTCRIADGSLIAVELIDLRLRLH
jgi:hypothetical protein